MIVIARCHYQIRQVMIRRRYMEILTLYYLFVLRGDHGTELVSVTGGDVVRYCR